MSKKPAIQLSDHFSYQHLIRFTLPSIAMMIFTSIYGVVDGFFVSNFAGKTPFAAVNFIIPVLMIMATVGFMLGTGGTAIVAKTLGEGDGPRARRYFSFFVYTAFGLGLVFAVLGFIFIRPLAAALGAEGALLDNAVVYAKINLVALPFFVLQLLFQSFFIAAEKPQLGFWTTLASGLCNMVLDAVLVLGLPEPYKLAGAAIATAMSQVLGGGIPLVYFARKNTSLLQLGACRFEGRVLAKAMGNGSSEFMSNVSMNVVGMLYNIQLLRYAGENGVAAYGVMMYVSMIFSGAFIGYAIGTAPIVSYHDGAQNRPELRSLFKKSLVLIGACSVMMVLASQLLARPLALIFVAYDPALLDLTISGFRVFALAFLLMGFAIYASAFFTALNDGLTSALISFLRTLVFQLAAVLLLPRLWGVQGIWWSIVVAELMAVLISAAFLWGKRARFV